MSAPGTRIIETLVEFTVWCKCRRCGKPSNLQGRWIRLINRDVDAEVLNTPCSWCQMRGMPAANLTPQYEIPKGEVMSYYRDRFGPIFGRGFLRN